MDYNAYDCVAKMLKDIGYRDIGNYLEKNQDSPRFFNNCINLILHKTPERKQKNMREMLEFLNIIPGAA